MEGDKSMEVKYYICKHCGNIVEKVKDKGVPVICCGEPMQEFFYYCSNIYILQQLLKSKY